MRKDYLYTRIHLSNHSYNWLSYRATQSERISPRVERAAQDSNPGSLIWETDVLSALGCMHYNTNFTLLL